MTKRYLPLLASLVVAGPPSAVLAQPVGPEFQVNTFTTDTQYARSIASDANGNFIVVWESAFQDGSLTGIFGQRYDSDGNPLGGEFQVNSYTRNPQNGPSVASDATGDFFVVWVSYHDGDSNGVFGQRYDSDGNRLGGEFQVNTYTTGGQSFPSIASDANGNFVVVWGSYGGQDGSDSGIFGQRYDKNGNQLGGEFQVNTYTTGFQGHSYVASDSSGNFVVVWGSFGQDGSNNGVFGQRYDNDGSPVGGEFQVNTYTTEDQDQISIASDANGNFVVVWESDYQDGSIDGVFGQRYDNEGNRLGGEFQINTYTTFSQGTPTVASDARGDFIVAWTSTSEDGSSTGVFGQQYDRNGNAVGGEFMVNTYTTSYQSNPFVASDARGNFVVVWTSPQDGSRAGVFGQRFAGPCEASLRIHGDAHSPGSHLAVQVHIAHHRPETVTVPWEMRLLDGSGRQIMKRTTEPHTFEPGDVVDKKVGFRLPGDLAAGTYTLELAISGMAGTKGATTSLRVVRAE